MALSLRDGDFFGGIEPFRPVIDGTEYKAQPLTLFKNGLWQTHKEVIIGTNQEEMSYVDSVLEGTGLPFPKRLFEVGMHVTVCLLLGVCCISEDGTQNHPLLRDLNDK